MCNLTDLLRGGRGQVPGGPAGAHPRVYVCLEIAQMAAHPEAARACQRLPAMLAGLLHNPANNRT